MSALVTIECNGCAVLCAPFPSADLAREQAREFGWAVRAPGGDDVDYCPKCTAPAATGGVPIASIPVSRVDVARRGITQLRDSLAAMVVAYEATPTIVLSVANLARVRADELLAELAS